MEKSIEVYGNIEIKDELDEKINNPIQVEYYKICNNKKKSTEKPYGIGVIKTYSDELETEVEKREFNHIFSNDNIGIKGEINKDKGRLHNKNRVMLSTEF